MRIINQKTKNSKLLNYTLALYLSFHVKLKGKNLISKYFFVFWHKLLKFSNSINKEATKQYIENQKNI